MDFAVNILKTNQINVLYFKIRLNVSIWDFYWWCSWKCWCALWNVIVMLAIASIFYYKLHVMAWMFSKQFQLNNTSTLSVQLPFMSGMNLLLKGMGVTCSFCWPYISQVLLAKTVVLPIKHEIKKYSVALSNGHYLSELNALHSALVGQYSQDKDPDCRYLVWDVEQHRQAHWNGE